MPAKRRYIVFLFIGLVLGLTLWAGVTRQAAAPEVTAEDSEAAGPRLPQTSEAWDLPASAVDSDRLPHIIVSPQAGADQPLPYYRIGPDTYMLYGNIAQVDDSNRGWNGNAGFVVTEEGVVVIDALGTPKLGRRFIATIRSVSERPITHLIVTHNHPDHAYGAAAFRELAEVTVIAHEGTLEYLASEDLDGSVDYRRSIIEPDMEGFEAVRPDVLIGGEPLTRQHSVSVGGKRFDIYNAGAHHSYGDLVVHQVEDRVLWISDLAFNHRTTFMGDGDSQQALAAQDWLLENFPGTRLMVPGHGSAQTAPFPMVRETRDYIARLRQEMADAVEEGIGMQEAIDNSDFADWHDTRLYEENHRRNASFVFQEVELELF